MDTDSNSRRSIFQMLVSPNKKAEIKISPAPGLLLYRSDKDTLFVQGKKDWNEIAMKDNVRNLYHY